MISSYKQGQVFATTYPNLAALFGQLGLKVPVSCDSLWDFCESLRKQRHLNCNNSCSCKGSVTFSQSAQMAVCTKSESISCKCCYCGLMTESLIGKGGFAEVYAKRDEATGQRVAMKQMTTGMPFRQFLHLAESCWAAEVLVMGAADHNHVLGCFGWDIQGLEEQVPKGGAVRRLYRMRFTMPLMAGSVEQSLMSSFLAPEQVAAWIQQAASGLHYLHTQLHVIHNDVKAGNFLVDPSGHLKLADLGLCTLMSQGQSYLLDTSGGCTPGYLAPERRGQINIANMENAKPGSFTPFACPASDVWALGVEFTRLYRRVAPEQRPLGNKLSADTALMCLAASCLKLVPADRITAHQLALLLERWLHGDKTAVEACALQLVSSEEVVTLLQNHPVQALSQKCDGVPAVSSILFSSWSSADSTDSCTTLHDGCSSYAPDSSDT
ncbi:hypothetical protein CEUSTIGMA_g7188.t1 [Chlamydomonas eustigma]|uniref:Protein kinase domain-containing protein n=1 Tax=Chlamydomonas eustigma TaxID=1157962 RepID=A0A250X9K4_9CHLO|nr:hypothetical protein CEUSTIGMA_g7188.t1 [Chlamydomonas eustigma]|eukprot:GAX79747.1 hypothetical protein CEUSTIGMA_g7188.t1 [Chlamydomonas eustigma]